MSKQLRELQARKASLVKDARALTDTPLPMSKVNVKTAKLLKDFLLQGGFELNGAS